MVNSKLIIFKFLSPLVESEHLVESDDPFHLLSKVFKMIAYYSTYIVHSGPYIKLSIQVIICTTKSLVSQRQ